MPIEYRPFITRQMLKDEPETFFVFGDNILDSAMVASQGNAW